MNFWTKHLNLRLGLGFVFLLTVSQAAVAEQWQTIQGEQEGRGGGVDISYEWGKFKFANGAREAFFSFRSRYSETTEVSVDVTFIGSDGKRVSDLMGGTLRPGQTLKDGGNYVIARSIEGYRLRPKPRQGQSSPSSGNTSPGTGVNVITYPGKDGTSPSQNPSGPSVRPVGPGVNEITWPDPAARQREQQQKQYERQLERQRKDAERREQAEQRRRDAEANRHLATADSYMAAGDALSRGLNQAGQQIVEQMNQKAERDRQREEEAQRQEDEREARRQEREERREQERQEAEERAGAMTQHANAAPSAAATGQASEASFQNLAGFIPAQNETEAIKGSRKAAAKGNANAKPTPEREAAEAAYAEAKNKYDIAVREGIAALRKAADATGDADAQYNLGARYEDGRGVSKDESEALPWYRKAAAQGNAKAKAALARMGKE